MMESESLLLVRRNVAIPGGTPATISAIPSSGIGPGPLGMADTRPSAEAPCSIARRASSGFWMQQIFTRRRIMLGFDHQFFSALVLTVRRIVRLSKPLPHRTKSQYRTKFRRDEVSVVSMRVSVRRVHRPPDSSVRKFHPTLAKPGLENWRKSDAVVISRHIPPVGFQNCPISPKTISRLRSSPRRTNPEWTICSTSGLPGSAS